jgi:hypothetical protein
MQAGIEGLRDILALDLDTFRTRVTKAAAELGMETPDGGRAEGWWDQARTLEEE